jgi:two-component system, chemotaxis family, chemotaxis protein CheY
MCKVLVIDDSPSALQMVAMTLGEAGYQVVACTDGKRAVQMLRHETFDLIVTDIYMPDEDGLEVIRKSRRICPGVPIVAMSGVTGKRNMLLVAQQMGARRTVPKPSSKADLLDAVKEALSAAPCGRCASSHDAAAAFQSQPSPHAEFHK